MQIEVDAVPVQEISGSGPAEPSAKVAERVAAARALQQERYAGEKFFRNAQMDSDALRKYCALGREASSLLNAAVEAMKLSMRGYNRILKTARTIADLDRAETVSSAHIAEAVQYRELDQKYWR